MMKVDDLHDLETSKSLKSIGNNLDKKLRKSYETKLKQNCISNFDKGSMTCPIINECRSIAQGDTQKLCSAGGLLTLYTVTGSAAVNGQVK